MPGRLGSRDIGGVIVHPAARLEAPAIGMGDLRRAFPGDFGPGFFLCGDDRGVSILGIGAPSDRNRLKIGFPGPERARIVRMDTHRPNTAATFLPGASFRPAWCQRIIPNGGPIRRRESEQLTLAPGVHEKTDSP